MDNAAESLYSGLDDPGISHEFNYLKSMFPDTSDGRISHALEESNYQLENAIDYLLTMATIDDLSEQAAMTSINKDTGSNMSQEGCTSGNASKKATGNAKSTSNQVTKFYYINSTLRLDKSAISPKLLATFEKQFGDGAATPKLTWKKLLNNALRLSDLTWITEKQAKSALHSCHGDFHDALVFIINNSKEFCNVPNVKENDPLCVPSKAVPERIKIDSGRRVQNNSFSLLKDHANNDLATTRESSPVYTPPYASSRTNNAYNNVPEDEEMRSARHTTKLEKIYSLHPDFQKLSYIFYVRALDHFNGDIDAVILLACVFIADDKIEKTWGYNPELSVKTSSPTFSWKPQKAKATAVKTISDSGVHLSESFKKGMVVDLHGYISEDAVSEALQVVADWWDTELRAREYVGTIKPNMKKAVCIAPVEIITGRGNHSAQGYSVIKVKVQKNLVSQGYLVDERPGALIVYGKKV